MRIGTKLILGYLLVLGLVGGALAVAMRSVTQDILISQTEQLMKRQVLTVAQRLGSIPREAVARSAATLLDTDMFMADRSLEELLVIGKDGRIRIVPERGLPPAQLAFMRTALTAGVAITRVVPLGDAPAGRPRLFGRDLRHEYVIAAAAPIMNRGQPIGVVMLTRPEAEATAEQLRVSGRIVFWMLFGILLAAVLSFLVARALTRRIGALSRAAHAMAEGDLSQRVPAEAPDEVGDLARAFNHMAGRVEGLVAGLKHSEQLRRDLMAAIAHELRTPVTSIRGFAEALKDGVVPDDRRSRYYEIIHSESARLTRLIQDLFDLAKLEAGQLEMRMQPIDLAPWLREFAEAQRHRLEAAHVPLEVAVPAGARAPILADQQRLEQVLHNLIDNAARYSPPGAPVQLSLEVSPAGVRVGVRDQGPGVAPEDAALLWERFYQGKDPGKRKGGAGLGLAIVRSIIAAHGGQVGLESEPGRGACFWFTLPPAPSGLAF